MNLTIMSNSGLQLCNYEMQLHTNEQPFFHTVVQLSGNFGQLHITRIDLPYCTIWMADYNVQEPITLHGFASQPVAQVCYHVPPKQKKTPNPPLHTGQQVHLTVTDFHKVSLPANFSKALFIHYHGNYFKLYNGNISTLFPFDNPAKEIKLTLNAAALTVLQQIISASPLSRIVHLYLEAKVKELLTLLHPIALPPDQSQPLTSEEIAKLRRVREIITGNLGNSYSVYQLAKMVGTNAYTLRVNFKTWFGIHIHLFQHNCRMEKASLLLQETTLSIKEIAYSVGYKNLSNFSELFKKYYGYPPSKIRE